MRGTSGARIAGLALALLAFAAPAGATITPVPHNVDGATLALTHMVGSGNQTFTSADFYTGPDKVKMVPPGGNPVAYADGASGLAPFPRDGTEFMILSTGDATAADDIDQIGVFFPTADDKGPAVSQRGASAFDTTVMQIPFGNLSRVAPSCLSFDLRFLSEEYPSRLLSSFSDAFVAELDATSWTTTASGISAPNDFAALANGQPLTIKGTGIASMSPSEAAGTPYGAATSLLHAQVFVPLALPPGAASHILYLSLFDQGDHDQDSAVFIDKLALTLLPAGSTAIACPSGLASVGPAVAITAPSVSATVESLTPTLTGTATDTPSTVTVRIYSGAIPAGTAVQTLTAQRAGGTWSAPVTQALAPGQYTAQATQVDSAGISGVSPPATFTVAQPRSAPQGGSSQQQAPGDRDNDGIPDDVDTSDGSLPPIPGKTFDARVVSGDVFIKYPAGKGPRAAKPLKGFVPLKGAANVPIGSQLDTRKGRVAVTSAADTSGVKAQTSDFYDGIFAVKQAVPKNKPKKPVVLITDLVLKGEPSRSECAPLKGAAAVAAAKEKKRGAKSVLGKLWGNGKGKFRTTGKYSSATVRGTIWLTQDRCDGTLTTVKRGTVTVRDFKRKKTVTVKAGHSYLARAQRATTKAARTK